jgi:NIMA (never in mitosis gene a)-related kinase
LTLHAPQGKLYIITEYAGNGNLHDYIKKQKTKLPEDLVWKLFIQILLGLNHMHSRKILHRDIKTLNVFLSENIDVKLGDMGVAKILSTNTNMAKTIVGTPYYLSPELCEDKPYNEKSDVWALGIVLYECCTQRHPFDAENQGALILKILRGKYPAVTGYSPEISDLIKRCLTQNANRRPNTFKLLMLPSIRQKAEELGIPLPDQLTLTTMAEKLAVALKVGRLTPRCGPMMPLTHLPSSEAHISSP